MGGVVKKVTKPIANIVKGGGRFLGIMQRATPETTRIVEQTVAKVAKPAPGPATLRQAPAPVMPKEAISPKEAVRGEGEGEAAATKRQRKRRGMATGARGVLGTAPTAKKTLLGG